MSRSASRGFRGAVSQMAADRWAAVSSDVKDGRRPMLVAGFGDATGGWRGSSITHFEVGIASWEAKDIKQTSKSALLPAALAEGDDGADNLRLRFEPTMDGFNDLASTTTASCAPSRPSTRGRSAVRT